jgi:hypothetical protein
MADISDCPSCGKKTLVHRRDELYQCLGCDYKKDFAAPPAPKSNAVIETGIGLLIGFTIYLIYLVLNPSPQPPSPQPAVFPGAVNPDFIQ